MYGFPRRTLARPRRYRQLRYFDAFQFGSPRCWWAVDAPIIGTHGTVVGFYDKTSRSGSLLLTSGTTPSLESTPFGYGVRIYNRVFSASWISITGNDQRTILFVNYPTFVDTWIVASPIYWYGNLFFALRRGVYRYQRGPSYMDFSYIVIGSLQTSPQIVCMTYDGSVLSVYDNGSLVATATIDLSSSSGSFSIGSFSGAGTVRSNYCFFECVVYPHVLDANTIADITSLLLAQYRM